MRMGGGDLGLGDAGGEMMRDRLRVLGGGGWHVLLGWGGDDTGVLILGCGIAESRSGLGWESP